MIDFTKFNYIDYNNGLERMGGDLETYELILRDYVNEFRSTYKQVLGHIDQDENEDLIRVLHTFKGVSGSIGCDKLYQLGISLEASAKSGTLVKTDHNLIALEAVLNDVISELESGLSETELHLINTEELFSFLEELKSYLEGKKYREAKEIARVLEVSSVPEMYIDDVILIADFTKRYKIKEAIETVTTFLKEKANG